jgi:Rrf2 family nitric oxide-sensitive transcriptional repressor
MQLTTHTDYALRLLIYLAVHRGDDSPTVRDAANRYGISTNHLAKVAQHLVQRGYITSQRGRSGGLALRQEPEGINVGELVCEFEAFNLVECLGRDSLCRIEPDCRFKQAIEAARDAFLDTLRQYTLADLIQPQAGLVSWLKMRENA